MGKNIFHNIKSWRKSVKIKIALGLGAIAAMLLLSSIISVLEYRRMSNYLSDLIAANVRGIDAAQRLVSVCDEYNLAILTSIGEEVSGTLPDFDTLAIKDRCDSLTANITLSSARALADSASASALAYLAVAKELDMVIYSEFIDTRDWYFNRLQPCFNKLRSEVEQLNDVIFEDLENNSLTFQDSFYRSIMPGIVSVGVGLVLVLLLLFFINVYYLNPLYKMLSGMESYRDTGHRYNYTFDGGDQLSSLNDCVTDLVEENIELRRRNKILRDSLEDDL